MRLSSDFRASVLTVFKQALLKRVAIIWFDSVEKATATVASAANGDVADIILTFAGSSYQP
ncbi:hypothetical protein [Rhizobium oryzicola]|uniref:Uncharacterized protein n=1 Tax=Rhizobium oryzicola TaxID=1232668 RepID=A0ABT8SR03_9HYPH|nr:hypothetical protein [Rhizobium oryzicola]MDO1580858.1 hypothetical protein [Rhizobium oryzicola]